MIEFKIENFSVKDWETICPGVYPHKHTVTRYVPPHDRHFCNPYDPYEQVCREMEVQSVDITFPTLINEIIRLKNESIHECDDLHILHPYNHAEQLSHGKIPRYMQTGRAV